MKFKNPMLIVKDMEKSRTFYKEVLGLRAIADFGANVTLTGGLCLQTEESWRDFINVKEDEICYGGKDMEIYFEEDDFDSFAGKLEDLKGNGVEIRLVHPVFEHRWGQRVVRFFDPDGHIIEVGENLKFVCKRFVDSGMTVEETAVHMGIPERMVRMSVKAEKEDK